MAISRATAAPCSSPPPGAQRMSDKERAKFADKLERAANLFLCDCVPEPWPDWMTPEKRERMSERFREYACELRE
jgi:hypothetical protein